MGFGLFLPEADGLGSVASPSFCGACTEEEESACRMSSSSGLVLAACLRFFTELQPMHPRAAHRQREQPILRFRALPAVALAFDVVLPRCCPCCLCVDGNFGSAANPPTCCGKEGPGAMACVDFRR